MKHNAQSMVSPEAIRRCQKPHARSLFLFFALTVCFSATLARPGVSQDAGSKAQHFPLSKTDREWKQILTPEQYHVMREKGTERPFSGRYDKIFQPGIYRCAACGNELFKSDTKYDPGEGWPSFWKASSPASVLNRADNSMFMHRTEVVCARCGSHLGHVFDDGPKPTGMRYCMNSVSLKFEKKK